MRAYKFAHMILEFNSLLDSGDFADITIDEVRKHLEAGTVSTFLADHFGEHADFSIIEAEDWAGLNEEWQRMDNAIEPRRRLGVEKSGLCLLIGFALQSIQSRIPRADWQLEEPDQ